MIDYNKIINKYPSLDGIFHTKKGDIKLCMKQILKEAIPIILKEVADNAKVRLMNHKYSGEKIDFVEYATFEIKFEVNKESILNLQSKLEKKLL